MEDDEKELCRRMQRFMEDHIPLAREAKFRILALNDHCVRMWGPYGRNYNHHNTVFGGSISILMILCGWLMAQNLVDRHCPGGTIVIESHTTEFLSPVKGDFIAHCGSPEEGEIERVVQELAESGRARLELSASLFGETENEVAARFGGIYYVRGAAGGN